MGFSGIAIERLYFTEGRKFDFVLVSGSKLWSAVEKLGTKFAALLQLSIDCMVDTVGHDPIPGFIVLFLLLPPLSSCCLSLLSLFQSL